MQFDIRTITFIMGATYLMQVLVFLYQVKTNKNIKGPGWWLAWSVAGLTGFIFILLRRIPEINQLMIAIQNPVILAGFIFLYIGVAKFFEHRINIKLVISFFLVFLFLHLGFLFIKDDIIARTLVISFYFSFLSFLTGWLIFRKRSESVVLTANFNIIVFVLHGCVFLYRGIMVILGADVSDFYSTSFFNFISFFDGLIVSLLWTFGFIMLVNEKLYADLKMAKTHFEVIFKTSPDAVTLTRLKDGYIVDCNEGFTRITGYGKKDLLNSSTLSINLWKNPADRETMTKNLLRDSYCDNYEAVFRLKNGKEITGLMSAGIIKLNDVDHVISVTRDITDRKLVEEELRVKGEALKKLNMEKDKFFSIIAHDLKSPLHVFMGLSEIIVNQSDRIPMERIRQIAGKMNESAKNLYSLLDNLLEWSRIERGMLTLNQEPVVLDELVRENLKQTEVLSDQKTISLEMEIEAGIIVYADRLMLDAIFRNLLSNAVKFTGRSGKILVKAEIQNEKYVKISVADNGIGMDETQLEKLRRGDIISGKGTENESGTGLGMIICREFIAKNKGEIELKSTMGKGTEISFSLPLVG